VSLSASQVYGFSHKYLQARYDGLCPTPPFHREIWALCCSEEKKVAIAAPRGHSKSTCVTHAFVLAALLFREKRYVLIISDTEGQATEFLGDIKMELSENVELMQAFGVHKFLKDSATDVIVEFTDGSKFRIRAVGAEQKVRGRKWGGTRPDLIVCDDLESDEAVESDARREKFKNWFFKAVLPAMSDRGHIRVIGTILHLDSLLFGLINNKSWKTKLYRAHKGFDDFSELLWPEKWPVERLKAERDQCIHAGISDAYATEYLNNPIDQAEAFFRKSDFLEMEESHFGLNKIYYAAIDFAISDADKADWTVIVVGGMDQFGILHIVDVNRFRGDMDEILLNMMAAQKRYDVELWKAEEGAIKKTLFGELQRRMVEKNVFLNVSPGIPTKDKRTRARPLQARMRAGGVRFDKNADWYSGFEEEFLHFPKGAKKDQIDATAWLAIALAELNEAQTPQEEAMDEYDEMVERSEYGHGKNMVTGY
jgi:predicted phage terminase large subunit-like protein